MVSLYINYTLINPLKKKSQPKITEDREDGERRSQGVNQGPESFCSVIISQRPFQGRLRATARV